MLLTDSMVECERMSGLNTGTNTVYLDGVLLTRRHVGHFSFCDSYWWKFHPPILLLGPVPGMTVIIVKY